MTDSVLKSLQLVKVKMEQGHQERLYYHNMDHVKMVLNFVTEIANATPEISSEQLEMLQLAAVFHDVCFHENQKEHEVASARWAEQVLAEMDYDNAKIKEVGRLILATRHMHQPVDILEKILVDADLAHLHSPKYLKTVFTNLYHEQAAIRTLTPDNWVKECIGFFDRHTYLTDYANDNFSKGKKKNRKRLEELSKMHIDHLEEAIQALKKGEKDKVDKAKDGKKAKKKQGSTKPDRGIETLFRVTLPNHINLSQIADNKANTLISINGIIISIVLSVLFPNFSSNQVFFIPAIVLLALCVVTIAMAMISTIPRTTHGTMTREDVIQKRGNLTFFGNFHHMEGEDFEWGIEQVMNDNEYLYKSLTRDLFHLGKVLNKKYIFLRVAYLSFILNLIVSISLFVIFYKGAV